MANSLVMLMSQEVGRHPPGDPHLTLQLCLRLFKPNSPIFWLDMTARRGRLSAFHEVVLYSLRHNVWNDEFGRMLLGRMGGQICAKRREPLCLGSLSRGFRRGSARERYVNVNLGSGGDEYGSGIQLFTHRQKALSLTEYCYSQVTIHF